MGWMEATIIFVTGLIIFAVMLPIGQALLPDMQNTMGSTVVLMVSSMFIIILVFIFYVYMQQSQGPNHFMGGDEQEQIQ